MHLSFITISLVMSLCTAIALSSSSNPIYNALIRQKLVKMLNEKGGTRVIKAQEIHKPNCYVKKFNRTILRPGCRPVTIQSQFCYGMCPSFHIMGFHNRLKSCECCTAIGTRVVKIELKCPSFVKQVKRIREVLGCRCKMCTTS